MARKPTATNLRNRGPRGDPVAGGRGVLTRGIREFVVPWSIGGERRPDDAIVIGQKALYSQVREGEENKQENGFEGGNTMQKLLWKGTKVLDRHTTQHLRPYNVGECL